MFPITSFDERLGLWVRALAIGDGQDLTVLTVIDGEGWLWDYANKCQDCGTKQLSEALAADPELAARGMRPESFNLHATHSHTSMDFLAAGASCPTGTWRRPPRPSSRRSRTPCSRWSRPRSRPAWSTPGATTASAAAATAPPRSRR
jgi:hypothetical protein